MKIFTTAGLLCLIALVAGCGHDDDGLPAPSSAHAVRLQEESRAYANESLDSLRANAGAKVLAAELFDVHCADCHGSDGRGRKGVVNLTKGRFNYGASADAIRTTIRFGRQSEMPRLGNEYGEVDLGEIVAYVEAFGTETLLSAYEDRGRELYAKRCADCHGADGRGRPELGAPDLTDDYWLHGDSMMSRRLVITRGVRSECPPQGDVLSAAETKLLTAFVLGLMGDAGPAPENRQADRDLNLPGDASAIY